jgi:iron complex transport system ATP-binding protein
MIIQVDNLTLEHPGKTLCRSLSVTINVGECWAILGKNGSGKTTLLNALAGLGPPKDRANAGILADGKPPHVWRRREFARNLGILLQEEPGEFWGNVEEYVLLGRHPHLRSLFGWDETDREIAVQALERMELKDVAHRRVGTLSGGERQRARIALLLAQSPSCYLLDEPLQHLDLRHQLATLALFHELARKGRTVVMVLHDANWASRFCSHVLMLFDNGSAIAGPITEVLNHANLETLYHCPMHEIGIGGVSHFIPADAAPRV